MFLRNDDRGVPFIVSLSKTALSHVKPAFAGTSRNSCQARGHHKKDNLYQPLHYAISKSKRPQHGYSLLRNPQILTTAGIPSISTSIHSGYHGDKFGRLTTGVRSAGGRSAPFVGVTDCAVHYGAIYNVCCLSLISNRMN